MNPAVLTGALPSVRKCRVTQGGQLSILRDSHRVHVEVPCVRTSGIARCDRGLERSPGRRRRARGQSSAEFALSLPVFFVLICGVMDFGRMFFIQENVQQAVEAGARYASTGNHQSGTDPKTGKSYSRTTSISNYIAQQASIPMTMKAQLGSVQISSVTGGAGSAGGPQDIETISVTTTVPLMTPIISHFFPNGQYTFTASATIKNEPFSPGQTM
jgi:Flp pilus assembly protein TadG